MALVKRNFEWQEDIDNFDFTKWVESNRGAASSYMVHYNLTWKGKLRKLFRIKKQEEK